LVDVIRENLDRLARLERVGWLAAGLTHDLNNTLLCVLAEMSEIRDRLTELRGFTALPERDAARSAQAIDSCEGSVDKLGTAIQAAISHGRHLQRLYRGESVPPDLWRVDLRDAVGRAMSIAPPRLRPMLDLTGPSALVAVDRETIVRVLLNLLINAFAALPARAEHGRIRVRLAAADRWATCDVTDNGTGVSPQILPRLFEPFATTKSEGTGTGLGLAVSRHLLRAAGGDLALVETGALGTTFRMVLPLADPSLG
jgi:two-component system C4-dicarboxylate transport sensor histidine kinase DctB